jgi:hypothetical protein
VAAVAALGCFGGLFGWWFQLLIELRSFVLRSFAHPAFTGLHRYYDLG